MFEIVSASDYFEPHYALRKTLASFDADVAEWERLSAADNFLGREITVERYGDHPRQTIEIFKATPGKPGKRLAAFIHGGFWRAMQREQSRFMATPFLKRGYDCAIVEYRLMPGFRLHDLVDDALSALRHLTENAERLKLPAAKIVAGHSAGAHLALYATMAARERDIKLGETALLLFSGVFDIFPVGSTSIGAELAMPREEIARWSIYAGAGLGAQKAAFAIGGQETGDFKRQTFLAAQLLGRGDERNIFTVHGANHLTLLTRFASEDALCDAMLDLL